AVGRMVAQLAAVDFLGTLDAKQLEALAKEARWESYLPGERVVRQGEPGEVLYVIASGKADVRLEQGGLSSTVTTLEAGKFFGEMSLLTGEPRSATVSAATELLVIAVGKQSLLQVVQEDRRLIERIGEVVARRQAATAAAKAQLSREAAALSAVTHTRSLVERIQNFFWGARKAQ
ncbi:MAG TPA: cyclic nucleotide-binding domain-containing protein, partial [Planctomycetaceae bacterium]|nr:cyclic nucleotide-binding domain-containing protein [Planctomycetaceae bacterium]